MYSTDYDVQVLISKAFNGVLGFFVQECEQAAELSLLA